jgi:putative FmdB family regulatory protein
MPFYEYECSNCKFYSEVMQKISDKPMRKCPSCGKNTFGRLISAPVFRLKGSGWYETDFKSDKENKRNLAGEDQEATADTKADTKAEAKTETKAEPKAEAKTETKAEPAVKAPARARPAAKGAAKPAGRSAAGSRPKSRPAARRAAPARKK